MQALEHFLAQYPHIIAAIEAASTLAAVIVSLWLALGARSANKTHLRATAGVSIIIHPTVDQRNPPSYLRVTITNVGSMPLRVPYSFFSWRLPFHRTAWMVTPLDSAAGDPWMPQQRYPVEIVPRASHSFALSDAATFEQEMLRMTTGAAAIKPWQFWFLRGYVTTDDGMSFRVTLDSSVRNRLVQIQKQASQAVKKPATVA